MENQLCEKWTFLNYTLVMSTQYNTIQFNSNSIKINTIVTIRSIFKLSYSLWRCHHSLAEKNSFQIIACDWERHSQPITITNSISISDNNWYCCHQCRRCWSFILSHSEIEWFLSLVMRLQLLLLNLVLCVATIHTNNVNCLQLKRSGRLRINDRWIWVTVSNKFLHNLKMSMVKWRKYRNWYRFNSEIIYVLTECHRNISTSFILQRKGSFFFNSNYFQHLNRWCKKSKDNANN